MQSEVGHEPIVIAHPEPQPSEHQLELAMSQEHIEQSYFETNQPQLEHASSSIATAAQCFLLSTPAELFDIGSGRSDCTESGADDADDEFWWSEFQATAAQEATGTDHKRPAPTVNELGFQSVESVEPLSCSGSVVERLSCF